MKIGVQALGVIALEPGTPGELGFGAVSEAGFDGVDMSLEAFYDTRSVCDPSIPCFYDRSLDELKRFFEPYAKECAKYGLEFIQAHAPFVNYAENRGSWEHFKKIVKRTVDIAGFLGSPYIVVHPLVSGEGRAKYDELELNRDYFLELAPAAKASNIRICIENLFYYSGGGVREYPLSEAEEAGDFIRKLNSDAGGDVFRYCFDIGHAALLAQDVRSTINSLSGLLAVTHLHDNNGVRDLHALPFSIIPNWGRASCVDWDGFIQGMRDIAYDGTLNFETAGIMLGLPEELKGSALNYTASAGKYLREKIEYKGED